MVFWCGSALKDDRQPHCRGSLASRCLAAARVQKDSRRCRSFADAAGDAWNAGGITHFVINAEIVRATTMSEWLEEVLSFASHGGLLALCALALGTLISEDIACIAAGLLVAKGTLDYWSATIACAVGIFLGDLMLVGVGRVVGRRALRVPPRLARAAAALVRDA